MGGPKGFFCTADAQPAIRSTERDAFRCKGVAARNSALQLIRAWCESLSVASELLRGASLRLKDTSLSCATAYSSVSREGDATSAYNVCQWWMNQGKR